jgi:hypothetical protein
MNVIVASYKPIHPSGFSGRAAQKRRSKWPDVADVNATVHRSIHAVAAPQPKKNWFPHSQFESWLHLSFGPIMAGTERFCLLLQ